MFQKGVWQDALLLEARRESAREPGRLQHCRYLANESTKGVWPVSYGGLWPMSYGGLWPMSYGLWPMSYGGL